MTTPAAKKIIDHALAIALFQEFGQAAVLVHAAKLHDPSFDVEEARRDSSGFWTSYTSAQEAAEAMTALMRGSQDTLTFMGAFVLELLLKAVLAHEGKLEGLVASKQHRRHLHDLAFLLDQTSSTSKAMLLGALDMQVVWRHAGGGTPTREEVFAHYADYFARYRYLYEADTGPWGPQGGGFFLMYQALRVAQITCRLLGERPPPFLAFPDRG